MDRVKNNKIPVFTVMKVLIVSYLVTGIVLLLLAFFLYKFELGEGIVNGGIIAAYILSCFLGGFLMGKLQKTRKFLWGMVVGCIYYAVLLVVSLLMRQQSAPAAGNMLTSFLMCTGSGMLGGMLS